MIGKKPKEPRIKIQEPKSTEIQISVLILGILKKKPLPGMREVHYEQS